MGTSDEHENRLRRVEANLEAREVLNRYAYGLDSGAVSQVLACFAEDAVLDVVNFPPKGNDMHFANLEEISALYEPFASRAGAMVGGHNTTNVSVAVNDDGSEADLTAYFITTHQGGLQGGRYEAKVVNGAAGWRYSKLNIICSWGWSAETQPVSEAVPLVRSWFGGLTPNS